MISRSSLGTFLACAGASTNSFDDIEHARALLVVGANVTESHPVVGAQMLDAALEGRSKALYAIGYDLLMTCPDLERTRRALDRLELVVVQDMFMTETGREHAHVFLPTAVRIHGP